MMDDGYDGCFTEQNYMTNQIIGLYHDGIWLDPTITESFYMMHSED